MKYIKTFENKDFAEYLKVGDFIISKYRRIDDYIFVAEVTMNGEDMQIRHVFNYNKASKEWKSDSYIKMVFSHSYINKEYRKLKEKELEEIKLSLVANKYNL